MPFETIPFVPYPPIERHAVVGDRRTAALIAADGNVDWLCFPNYDGAPVFDSLLDAEQGGFWRLGPAIPTLGIQLYEATGSAVLTTRWESADGTLELTDFMAWPEDDRTSSAASRRALVRRLRCIEGGCDVVCSIKPSHSLSNVSLIEADDNGLLFTVSDQRLRLWTSVPLPANGNWASTSVHLTAGDDFWAVLDVETEQSEWSASSANEALEATRTSWKEWNRRITYTGPRADRVRRAAATVRLLAFAPNRSAGCRSNELITRANRRRP